MSFVFKVTTVAALGGLLFGYDTAVIAGAIGFLEQKFTLSAAMKGWAASCALLGCVIGAVLAGPASDRFGRKKVMIWSAVCFALSAIGSATPESLDFFVAARILGGIGVGASSILSPLYIAEISPAAHRGRLVTLYQLGIVSGILLVYFVNSQIAGLFSETWNIESGWRWMLGSETLPAVLFFLMLFTVPESPRWLAQRGQEEESLKVLTRLNSGQDSQAQAAKELEMIEATIKKEQSEKVSFARLLQKGTRWALFVGITLAVFSQITGINAIMYYAPEIFKNAGSDSSSALMQTVVVGAVNLTFTFAAIKYIDLWGRRALLLVGSIGMAISLSIVGLAFQFGWTHPLALLLPILTYIACFAMSFGPVTWVVISEIFPGVVRGRAMSVAIVALWLSVFAVSQTFPMMLESFGSAQTFWAYMLMSVAALIFIIKAVPETKGRSLEQIEAALI